MVRLALLTGIPVSAWEAEDERVVETAWMLLEEAQELSEDAMRDAQRRAGQ